MNHGESLQEHTAAAVEATGRGGRGGRLGEALCVRGWGGGSPTLNDKCLAHGGLWEVHTNK